MRCLVTEGIEVATGELLRTIETVGGESLRGSARNFRVTGLCESFVTRGLAVIWRHRDACATYAVSCTPSSGSTHRVVGERGNDSDPSPKYSDRGRSAE